MSGTPTPPGGLFRGKITTSVAVVAAVCAGAFAVHSYLLRKAASSPSASPAITLGPVPDFSLTSEQGRTVTLKDYAGTVWIADFIFVQCGGSCPAMTSRMSALTRTLRDTGVRFVSFDVDPDRDGVAELAAYAKSAGADPARWSFLRGEKPVIRALSRDGFKLAVEDGDAKDPEPVLHSTRFVLVDGAGTIHGTYDSLDEDRMSALVSDARRLAADTKGAAKEPR